MKEVNYEEIAKIASMTIGNMEEKLFGANTINNESISLFKILKAKEKINNLTSKNYEWYEIKEAKEKLEGLKIIEHNEVPMPKLKLSKKVDVSEDFRRVFDCWLEKRFGYIEPLFKDNECYIFNDVVIMKPEMAALIRNIV